MLCHDFSSASSGSSLPLLYTEPPCSAGYRSLLSTAGGTVALPAQTGPGRERCAAAAAAVMRPLCPHLQWVPCAPLTFCFSYAAVM